MTKGQIAEQQVDGDDLQDALGLAHADLTERVADAMRGVSQAYVAAVVRTLKAGGFEGLTPASISLLARVPRHGAQTVELASQTRRTKQATGKLVFELEAAGYVERAVDPKDRRGLLVRPTRHGLAALAMGAGVKSALTDRAVEILGLEALERLYRDLALLKTAMMDASAVSDG